MEKLTIHTLGDFNITLGSKTISDKTSRSKKVWVLIAYLFTHKGRIISRKELIDILWGFDSNVSNPENSLKITLKRARDILDELYENLGHTIIQYKNNGYLWNEDYPFTTDTDLFEEICSTNDSSDKNFVEKAVYALGLYNGPFLSNISESTWLMPMQAYYHALYLNTILTICPILIEHGRFSLVKEICFKASVFEPYHEGIYSLLMLSLIESGENKKAEDVYHTLSGRLKDDFGISAGQEIKELYNRACRTNLDPSLNIDTIMEHIHEGTTPDSSLELDYEFFKVICFIEGRNIIRNKTESHVILFSIAPGEQKKLDSRMKQRAAELFKEQLFSSLRRNDIFTQASLTQFIVLLKNTNYQNSLVVSARITGDFYRKNPHSPANIIYTVKPITPLV